MSALCWCCTIPVLILALVAGVAQYVLRQPVYAEAAVRKLVEVSGIPQDIWKSFEVVDDSAWYDIITGLNLGIAEGYMHGKIKMEPLEFFFTLLNDTALGTRRKDGGNVMGYIVPVLNAPTVLAGYLTNQQTPKLSRQMVNSTYDVFSDLYEAMLGPAMSYTCAYWKDAKDLEQAQVNKFNLIFRKLETEPGMKLAELGVGWGTAAKYMHEQGQLDVTGVSLSEQQTRWASEHFSAPGLRFICQDYRDFCEDPSHIGAYDRVYSMGMLEHIGHKNFDSYFKCVKKLLKPEGLAVIHSIGEPDFVPASDPFLDTYIFPGAVIPALSTVMPAVENLFIVEDFQNFGYDYAKTLAAWSDNSEAFFKNNPQAYNPEFQRMWQYYLRMCEALFELRINQLWHFVLSPRPAHRRGIARQL
mmetsp:Transcript_79279/g.156982  ORF Transcript_79279/g.156982 Transcript_79279/m.156982 type:complete len:414 (-) Transcript_79279:443-1684(-)